MNSPGHFRGGFRDVYGFVLLFLHFRALGRERLRRVVHVKLGCDSLAGAPADSVNSLGLLLAHAAEYGCRAYRLPC